MTAFVNSMASPQRLPTRAGYYLFLPALFIAFALSVFAQGAEPGVTLARREKQAHGERVVLAIAPPESRPARAPNGQSFTKLSLAGTGLDNDFGRPALPVILHSCEIPAGMKVTATVEARGLKQLKVPHPLWPHQPPVPKTPGVSLAGRFQVDAEAYGNVKGATFQKSGKGELTIKTYRKRGKDYADIAVRPFTYQAKGNVVQYPSELVLDITYVAPDLPKAAGPRTGPIIVLELELANPAVLDYLTREGYNFERRAGNRVEIFATEAEAQMLRNAGYPVREVTAPASQETTPLDKTSDSKASSSYHNYAGATAVLQQLTNDFPNTARLQSIGRSTQNRELWALKITTDPDQNHGKPRVRLGSTLHGDEPVGTELCLYLADLLLNGPSTNARVANLVAGTEIWILPLLNPDGLESNSRFNAGGFDLNRSFPDGGGSGLGNPVFGPPASFAGRPPEVAGLMQFALSRNFTLAANFHGGALVVNYPYDDDDLGTTDSPTPDDALFRAVARGYSSNNPPMWASTEFPNGIVNGAAWYVIHGGMQDWHYRYAGCNEVTIELGNSKRPAASTLPQLWQNNREAMLRFIESVHTGVGGQITDAATGLPLRAALKPLGNDHAVFNDPTDGRFQRMLLPGACDLLFIAPGYHTYIISNVVVEPGKTTLLDVALQPATHQSERIILVSCNELRNGLTSIKTEKLAQGFQVQDIVTFSGSRPEQIRSRIRDVYSVFPADYVLIVGDHELLPAFTNGLYSDLPYCLMDAGESYADYLGRDTVSGRISLKTVPAVQEFAQKLAAFYRSRDTRLHDLTWVAQGDDAEQYAQAERGHEWCINNAVPATYKHNRFYSTNGTAAQLTGHINQGTDGVIYSGHGSISGWARFGYDADDLAQLYNLDRVPLVIGHCCQSGSFQENVCFGEAWLQTASRGVAYVGATADTYWDEDEELEKAEFEAMQLTAGLSIGKALDEGLARVHQFRPGNAEYYYTIYHVLGDPSLSLIETVPGPLLMRTAPELPSAHTGTPYSVSLRAAGGIPPYTWHLARGALPAGLAFYPNTATISGTPAGAVTNQFTVRVTDSSAPAQTVETEFTLAAWNPGQLLNRALGLTGWTWTVSEVPWILDTTTSLDGQYAARSGAIDHNQQTWMETTITGPGTLSFWWRVSSEDKFDFLYFYLDGQLQGSGLSGNVNWQQVSLLLTDGSHVLRWVYIKDVSESSGQDCGWVDQLTFTPAVIQPPAIVQTAVSQGQVRFSLATQSGQQYVIEYKDVLDQSPWQTLATMPGDGTLRVFTNDCQAASRFYRVRVGAR